ncbi:MAG: hypothetical protein II189_06970, partial [Lachnospiraceae bacterium]|nr:hypothetical protein [Lachnospiraceae bacterium]
MMGESLKGRVFAGNRQRKTFITEEIFLYNKRAAARHRERSLFKAEGPGGYLWKAESSLRIMHSTLSQR